MRFSYLFWALLLSCTLAQAQITFEDPGDTRPNITTPADCISLIDFDLPTSFDEQIEEIIQTGSPFGNQVGYTHIINRQPSCLPEGNLVVNFAKTGQCNRAGVYPYVTAYFAEVVFNDEIVASREIDGIGPESIVVPLQELGLDAVPSTPMIVPLELRIVERIYSQGYGYSNTHTYSLAQVMVVDFGSTLYFQHENPEGYTSTLVCNRVALGELDDILQNCSPTREITLDMQMTNFVSNSATNAFTASYNINASIGGNGSLGYQQQALLDYSHTMGINAGYSVTLQDQEILSSSYILNDQIVLPPRSDAGCSFMGLLFTGKRVYLRPYLVGCSYLLPGEVTDEVLQYNQVQPEVCTEPGEVTMDCYPTELVPSFRRHARDLIAVDGNQYTEGDCLLSISTTQAPEPDYGQTFIWEGPNNFVAFGPNIEDVPYGVYTLTVYDECGGETEFTIDPCEGGATTGSWNFDSETSSWCRSLSCSGGADCEGTAYQECVAAEFGEWVYDEFTGTACRPVLCPAEGDCEETEQCVEVEYGSWDYYDNGFQTICRRDIIALGESIEVQETPATLTYDFDPFTEQCVEYIRCGLPQDIILDLVDTELEEPVYEEWSYDESTEVCMRLVRCFDLLSEDVDIDPDVDFENPANTNWEQENQEPQYLWDYDDAWGCVGYVFCDSDELLIHPGNTDWELDFGQGQPVFTSVDYDVYFNEVRCVLDVDCEFNGVLYDTPEPFPPLTTDLIAPSSANFIGTPENGYCEFYYQCGDLPPFILDGTFVGVPTGTTTNEGPLCRVFCEGFESTTTHPQEVLCSSISGFVTDESRLSTGNELPAKAGAKSQLSPEVQPNPFNQQVTLRNLPDRKLRVVMLNVDGRIVLEQNLSQTTHVDLQTNHLPNGIYLLMLLGENEELLYERRLLKVD